MKTALLLLEFTAQERNPARAPSAVSETTLPPAGKFWYR